MSGGMKKNKIVVVSHMDKCAQKRRLGCTEKHVKSAGILERSCNAVRQRVVVLLSPFSFLLSPFRYTLHCHCGFSSFARHHIPNLVALQDLTRIQIHDAIHT